MSTFEGFSEEELKRIKSKESGGSNNESKPQNASDFAPIKKIEKIGLRPKVAKPPNRLALLNTQASEDIGDLNFEKCRLSLKSPDSPEKSNNNNINKSNNNNGSEQENEDESNTEDIKDEFKNIDLSQNLDIDKSQNLDIGKSQNQDIDVRNSEVENENTEITNSIVESAPDIVRGVANYTEEDVETHRAKLSELQLRQRLMEEQNKKRKEMLAKALADRAKRTEEEVQRLEKIKKELQVLDGQFSHDVAMLRKKIDQACHTYADAEKHYLKVEKEFLQAKINLQKEKENKELLTEHLCTLITHNETRKAQKLETLMLQLVDENKNEELKCDMLDGAEKLTPDDEGRIIVDGIDIKTGKMIEIPITR